MLSLYSFLCFWVFLLDAKMTSFAKSESECEPASRGRTTNVDAEQSAGEDADLLGDQLVLGDGEYEEVLRGAMVVASVLAPPYTDVQEPMMQAATSATNPFTNMFQQPNEDSNTDTQNTPLSNPWAPSAPAPKNHIYSCLSAKQIYD